MVVVFLTIEIETNFFGVPSGVCLCVIFSIWVLIGVCGCDLLYAIQAKGLW